MKTKLTDTPEELSASVSYDSSPMIDSRSCDVNIDPNVANSIFEFDVAAILPLPTNLSQQLLVFQQVLT